MRAYGSPRRRSGMTREADSAACRLVFTEAADARASRRYEAQRLQGTGGGVGSTHSHGGF